MIKSKPALLLCSRAQQINELLVSIPQSRAVNPERSLLEVPLQLSTGAAVALRITIPSGFPQERPVLSVTSPIQHPWVDSIGRLSFPSLSRWVGSNLRLAAVVSEAIQHLDSAMLVPGKGLCPSQAGMMPQPPIAGPIDQTSSSAMPISSQKLRLPPPRTHFPELQKMSNGAIAEALTDQPTYGQLLQQALSGGGSGGDGVQPNEVIRELRCSVEDAARRNISREAEMAELRNQIAIIRSSEYAPAKSAYDEKIEQQQKVLDLLSPKVLVQKLQAAAAAAEEESEDLYKRFSEGGLNLEAFVEEYTAVRALYHQRDLKAQAAVHTIPMDV